MKIFISADLEGITGVNHWDETILNKPDHKDFAHQMTLEVNAACKAANQMGAEEILVKDAHDSGRNINHNLLPKNTKLIRGWSGDSYSMVQGLDSSFDALIFIGYHSASSKDANPLSHTMNVDMDYVKLNGDYVDEFLIHSYIASYLGVPVVFVSGDLGLCQDIKSINEDIITLPVKEGVGNSTVNIHPELALELIQEGVKEALGKDLSELIIDLPESFELEVRYKDHMTAYKLSNYPGAELIDTKVIRFKSDDYMEIIRAMNFIL